MNTSELDRFFAQADDVLDNWPGSVDSMNTATAQVDIVPDVDRFQLAMQELAQRLQPMIDAAKDAAKVFGEAALQLLPAIRAAIEYHELQTHAFTPNYDLACTHPRCTLTAEEH